MRFIALAALAVLISQSTFASTLECYANYNRGDGQKMPLPTSFSQPFVKMDLAQLGWDNQISKSFNSADFPGTLTFNVKPDQVLAGGGKIQLSTYNMTIIYSENGSDKISDEAEAVVSANAATVAGFIPRQAVVLHSTSSKLQQAVLSCEIDD